MRAKLSFRQEIEVQFKEFEDETLHDIEDGNLRDIQENTRPQCHDIPPYQSDTGKSIISQFTLADYTSPIQAKSHLRRGYRMKKKKSQAYSQKSSSLYRKVRKEDINTSISVSKTFCIKVNDLRTSNQNTLNEHTLNVKLQGLDKGIVVSQLGGNRLRASTNLVSKDHRLVILLLWTVPVSRSDMTTNKWFGLKAVPIVNCSKLDDAYIAKSFDMVIREIKLSLCQQVNLINCSGESLFHEFSSLILEQKGGILDFLINSLPDLTNKSCGFLRAKRPFDQPPIKLSYFSDFFDIYEDADNAESTRISNLSESAFDVPSTKDKEGYCIICFDSFNENELYLSSCKHKACASCWR